MYVDEGESYATYIAGRELGSKEPFQRCGNTCFPLEQEYLLVIHGFVHRLHILQLGAGAVVLAKV